MMTVAIEVLTAVDAVLILRLAFDVWRAEP